MKECAFGGQTYCVPFYIYSCGQDNVKNVFFFIQATFLRFLTFFFILPKFFFLFLKTFIENIIEISFETTETNWVCMIVFLCAYDRISISTYILTSIVIYLPYRLTSSDVIRRCVFVYVGKLV